MSNQRIVNQVIIVSRPETVKRGMPRWVIRVLTLMIFWMLLFVTMFVSLCAGSGAISDELGLAIVIPAGIIMFACHTIREEL